MGSNEFKFEVHKTVLYENVEYDPSRQVFIAIKNNIQEQYSKEYAESMGWNYDSEKQELYEYREEVMCSECECMLMYDSQSEEFYCPICNN